MTIIRPLREAFVIQTVEDFSKKLETSFENHFPRSAFAARFSTGLVASLLVTFTLGKDKSEYPSGYSDNDPMQHKIMIDGMDKIGNLGNSLSLTPLIAGLNVKYQPDPKDSFPRAMTRLKAGLSKKTGTPEQIYVYLVKYFDKLQALVQENFDDILTDGLYSARSKV